LATARAEPTPGLESAGAQSDALTELVDTIAHHAYRVTDEQIEALRAAGYREDELFEVIVVAAVGSGVARRELGLQAVAAWKQSRPAGTGGAA
jgi:alkylhydroperoxidase family enzyme